MRRLLILALLALGSTAYAQQEERTFVRDYDIDTDAYVYCVSSPQIPGNGLIETSGSSATVTAVNAADAPFKSMGDGDLIQVVVNGAESFRYVVGNPNNAGTEITVNSAVDWSAGSGLGFTWRDVTCGTTVNDGWVSVATYSEKTITVEYNAGDLTGGLDVRFECRGSTPGALPVIVYPDADSTCGGGTYDAPDCNFATASIGVTNRLTLVIFEPYGQCRVGMKIGTSDGDDVGANTEQITAYLIGVKSAR